MKANIPPVRLHRLKETEISGKEDVQKKKIQLQEEETEEDRAD